MAKIPMNPMEACCALIDKMSDEDRIKLFSAMGYDLALALQASPIRYPSLVLIGQYNQQTVATCVFVGQQAAQIVEEIATRVGMIDVIKTDPTQDN